MAQIKVFLNRYKWWILAGSSVIMFGLLSLLASVVVLSENFPTQIETQVQIPTVLPSPQSKVIDTPTPIQEIINSPIPPAEENIQGHSNRQLAYVQRVIDGDSIEVILDGEMYELRYIGIDAPEIGKPYFDEATEANRSFVEKQIVELESDISDIDQYREEYN